MAVRCILALAVCAFVGAAGRTAPPTAWLTRLRGGENPPMYENNGGLVLAIAGEDFAVLAADTRLSQGYSILSRRATRIWEVAPGVWLGAAGCHADAVALAASLEALGVEHGWGQGVPPGVEAVATALSACLYQRRHQPYYAFCVLAGVDGRGRGAVFSFDAVGSCERVPFAAAGGGQALALPVLDAFAATTRRNHRRAQRMGGDKARSAAATEGEGEDSSGDGSGDEDSEAHFQRWLEGGLAPGALRPARVVLGLLAVSEAHTALAAAAGAAAERDVRLGDELEAVAVLAPRAQRARQQQQQQQQQQQKGKEEEASQGPVPKEAVPAPEASPTLAAQRGSPAEAPGGECASDRCARGTGPASLWLSNVQLKRH